MDDTGHENPASVPPPDDPFVHDDLPLHDSVLESELSPAPPRDDLDADHIHKVTHLRRTAHRSRGYLLIGSAFCAVLGVQLIWNSVGRFRGGYNVIAAAYLMAAAVLLALAWRAFGRAQQFKREADASTLSDPKSPPDLSQLSDGSQSWKNLEDMK